jgi:hypothetical protein
MHYYGKDERGRAAMVDLGGNESVRRVVLHSLAELRPVAEKAASPPGRRAGAAGP